jgi:hypothetical protein
MLTARAHAAGSLTGALSGSATWYHKAAEGTKASLGSPCRRHGVLRSQWGID